MFFLDAKRIKQIVRWIIGIIAVFAVVAFVFYYYIIDWQGRPIGHKGVMFAFKEWMGAQGMMINSGTNVFPNFNGRSVDSFAAIQIGMGGHMDWTNHYRYVPGLRENDPGDLVLLYIDRPTRWTWHGAPQTIFKEKAWLFVPLDFAQGPRRVKGGGEMSERVLLEEFRSRLQRTLEYVRTNERPNWQTIVAEHTRFLDSIGK